MPYKFKGAKDCTQKDGGKGKFLTIKKNGDRRCYKSEDNYKSAQAWAHESDEKELDELLETIDKYLDIKSLLEASLDQELDEILNSESIDETEKEMKKANKAAKKTTIPKPMIKSIKNPYKVAKQTG